MYLPKHFAAPDAMAVDALIGQYPLASVVLHPVAGQPLSVEPIVLMSATPMAVGACLIGHIARANPLGQALDQPAMVTAIFTGPRVYISPNWYPSKSVHHQVVPTYNYCTVVVQGLLRRCDDPVEKLSIVRQLTDRLEGERADAWSVDDAPSEYIDHMLAAIVGLSLEVTDVQAKFKISQNREALDRGAVQMELEAMDSSDARAMAALMNAFQTN